MHAHPVAPILAVAAFHVFEDDRLVRFADGNGHEYLELFGDVKVFGDGFLVDRTEDASAETPFGRAEKDALRRDSVVEPEIVGKALVAEDDNVGGRTFAVNGSARFAEITRESAVREALFAVFGRGDEQVFQRLNVPRGRRQSRKVYQRAQDVLVKTEGLAVSP
jgi:hypothetical protein